MCERVCKWPAVRATGMCLIPRSGEGRRRCVDLRHPAGGGHDPLAVVDAAYVRLVHKLASALGPGHNSAVDLGGFHLPEVGGNDAEHKHHLCDVLVGRQPQGHGGRLQHIVLLGVQAVRQHTVVGPGEIGLVDDLVAASGIVGAGGDLRQPYRLHGQGIPPIERGERRGGVVADVGERVADVLTGHDLGIAGFLDCHVGIKALVGHGRFDDLAGVFDLHVDGGLVQGVEVRSLGFHHLVAAQGQGLGHGHTILVGADGIDKVAGAVVVNFKHGAGDGGASGPAVHTVVVGAGLGHLDLPGNGGVLPGDGGAAAVLHINGLGLGVQDIALSALNFPDSVSAVLQFLVDIHIPLVVALVGADGVALGVGKQELHAENALAGHAVDFVNEGAPGLPVGDLQGGGAAVLYLDLMGVSSSL